MYGIVINAMDIVIPNKHITPIHARWDINTSTTAVGYLGTSEESVVTGRVD